MSGIRKLVLWRKFPIAKSELWGLELEIEATGLGIEAPSV